MSGFRKAKAEQAAIKMGLYGPPGCLSADTRIQYNVRREDGHRHNYKGGTIEHLYERFHRQVRPGKGYYQRPNTVDALFTAPCLNQEGLIVQAPIHDVLASGKKSCVLIRTDSGKEIIATEEHQFYNGNRYILAGELKEGGKLACKDPDLRPPRGRKRRPERDEIFVKHHPVACQKIVSGASRSSYVYYRLRTSRAVAEAALNNMSFQDYIARLNSGHLDGLMFLPRFINVHHQDENIRNNSPSNLILIAHDEHARLHANPSPLLHGTREETIASITGVGHRSTYDICMRGPDHNFLANDFVVHNSGKTMTSLLLAEGLARITGKRIAYIDTEHGTDFYCQAVPARAVHPEAFDFDALYTRSIMDALASVKGLREDEYSVVVIDSITHLWEAARAAYDGKQTRAGTIPMHAWGKIKKPYKDMISILLSSPMHVLICGRQGIEYATDDETDELKAIGVKMKAEGETPYEPHILLRMEALRPKKTNAVADIIAYAEKDRTGVLAGRSFLNPTFDSICSPLMGLLGATQARVATGDETASQDAEAIDSQQYAFSRQSEALLRELSAKIDLCANADQLKLIGKEITPRVKANMLPEHVAQMRERYLQREEALQ